MKGVISKSRDQVYKINNPHKNRSSVMTFGFMTCVIGIGSKNRL